MNSKLIWKKTLVSIGLGLAMASARAFDTGPHFDMTRDALSFEGFGSTATQVVQVSNWFNDLYEQDDSNAYSGHQPWWDSFKSFFANLITIFRKENWPTSITDAAERMHFDSSNPTDTEADCEREWLRLARATRKTMRDCAASGDIEGALCALGMSLHVVQDFYTHTNWTEPQGDRNATGFSGPGWAQRSLGSNPTWFDISPSERQKVDIYSRKAGSPEVIHGDWDSPNRAAAKIAMAKDSISRPGFKDAYLSACLASRQWIRAARVWLSNEAFWRQMMAFGNTHGIDLGHDQHGAYMISTLVGHWNGNTGAHSDKVQTALEATAYFEALKPIRGTGKSFFRQKWESLILKMADKFPEEGPTPVQTSAAFAGTVDFVQLNINHLKQIDDIDGPDIITENDADWYSKAIIAGQHYTSSMINGHNTFDFPAPYAPMAFIKMVPKQRNFAIPLSVIRVTLHTGNVDGAGTDMDLHLRINDQMRYEFPYGDFDDFERNRTDTYTFVMPNGLTLDDIGYLQLEKGGGGSHHEWLLGGMRVEANGVEIYRNDNINTWLRSKNQLYRVPLNPFSRHSVEVPVELELWDDDWGLTGGDEHADIFPLKGRKDLQFMYNVPTRRMTVDVNALGGTLIRGGGDSDRAELRLEMLTHIITPPPGGIRGHLGDITGATIHTADPKPPTIPPTKVTGRPPRKPPVKPPVKPPQ